MKSGADGFMIKMRDGRHLRCVHNNPQGGHLPDYAPHPAIVLKMEDGTGLLLPIIVCMSFLHPNSWQYQNSETCGFHMFVESINYFVCLKLLFTFYLQWRCRVCCSWQQCAMFKLYVLVCKLYSYSLDEWFRVLFSWIN